MEQMSDMGPERDRDTGELTDQLTLAAEQIRRLQSVAELYYRENEKLRAELEQARDAAAQSAQEAERATAELQGIYRSRSWRLVRGLSGRRR